MAYSFPLPELFLGWALRKLGVSWLFGNWDASVDASIDAWKDFRTKEWSVRYALATLTYIHIKESATNVSFLFTLHIDDGQPGQSTIRILGSRVERSSRRYRAPSSAFRPTRTHVER
jgi:hypothetical protein